MFKTKARFKPCMLIFVIFLIYSCSYSSFSPLMTCLIYFSVSPKKRAGLPWISIKHGISGCSSQEILVNSFNPTTQEAETGIFLSLRLAWSVEQFPRWPKLHWETLPLKTNNKKHITQNDIKWYVFLRQYLSISYKKSLR